MRRRCAALAQRLATQGITVYPVQATGLQVGILGTSTTAQGSSRGQTGEAQLRPMTRENDLRIWGTMDMLADVTGGRAFRNTNELTAGVRAAATDLRGSYSVGFYVPDNSDNRWREFDVRVSRPGVRVLHRKGYMALAPVKQPVNWSQAEWQAAMQNPLGSTAIRLDARADAAAGRPERAHPDCGRRSVLQARERRAGDRSGDRRSASGTRRNGRACAATARRSPSRKIRSRR